jgi:site-specific DNA-methyltransferase (adenine-specific)
MKLYNQDCLEAMKDMADNQYDLAIVDPPYGIGNFTPQNNAPKQKKVDKIVEWNDDIPNKEYFKELQRVSKNQIIWGANYYNCFSNSGGAIVWYKGGANTKNMSDCEIASYSQQKKIDFIKITVKKGFLAKGIEIRIHPCQKPIALYEWLLINYAKKGDKILDTHLGSGSIAIACHNLGYDLTGYEIDKEYYKASIKRIEQHKSQIRLAI